MIILNRQILIYKVLEVVFLFASLIFIGMALCLLIYSEHLCCDKGCDWVRWFMYSILNMILLMTTKEDRKLCEWELERKSREYINSRFKDKE